MLNSCGENAQRQRKTYRLSPPGTLALPHRNGGSHTPDTLLRRGGIFSEHSTDTVVLEKSWLSICGKLDICDDKHLIYRIYNPKDYEVADIGKRRKINLVVDLEQLYADHIESEVTAHGQS